MIYLTGVTNDAHEPALLKAGVGLMLSPSGGYVVRATRYSWWAADNACYAGHWDEDAWIDWLGTVPTERCLFAVAPDVYPDAEASLERGLAFAGVIHDMGLPVAIVGQDGAEDLAYPWEEFDCFFIGGRRTDDPRDEWKISEAAASVAKEARRHGKWVHMGRVNSWKRYQRARDMGCHSVDGTFLKHGPNVLLGALTGWSDRDIYEPSLPLVRHEGPSHPVHRAATAAGRVG